MFANLSIGRRLAVAFAAVIGVFLLVVWTALGSGAKLAEAEKLNIHTYEVLDRGEKLLQSMVSMQTGGRGYLLAGEDRYLEPWKIGQASFDKTWSEAKQLTADNPEQQKRLDLMKQRQQELKTAIEALFPVRQDVRAGSKIIDDLVSAFMLGGDKAAMDAFRSVHAEFYKVERELQAQRSAEAETSRSLNRWLILGGSGAALVIGVLLSIGITRSIVAPIQQAVRLAETVAAGDLSSRIEVGSHDETGQLLQALKAMNESLVKVVSTVRQSSDSIATGSSQIATGNADLSQRTEEQASNLQQTAASMEQLAGTVRSSADTAQQANTLASSARAAATEGGEVVARVVGTMDEISASSRRISDIISVIDGIAFQTNILALNAAVEAARAGEQGRGFAVVASEVRSLAQRSANAAKEIKSLINDSVEKVETGTRLVGDAGQAMEGIVAQVKRVADLIGEISTATVEQTSGIGQVSDAVGQLDQVTQQNAALVEQSAAAAESLKHQAGRLVEAVQVFKL